MKLAVLFALLAAGSCDQPQDKTAASPPTPPHFLMAMQPDSAGVYVLDTQTGMISRCSTTINGGTWCTAAVDAMNGLGTS